MLARDQVGDTAINATNRYRHKRICNNALLALTALAVSMSSAEADESFPKYKLNITVPSLKELVIKVDGSVTCPTESPTFAILPGRDYKYDINGAPLKVSDQVPLQLGAADKTQPSKSPEKNALIVHFQGTTTLPPSSKVQASEEEFYCLNKVYPNPEILADGGFYQCEFHVPPDFSILWPHSDVVQRNGLQFQVAKWHRSALSIPNRWDCKFKCRLISSQKKNISNFLAPF